MTARVTLLLLSLAIVCPAKSTTHLDSLPHIILLMGDDHGWDEVGYNGHPFLQTPVLDQMAAQGLRMDHFYAAHPSCSPTRGSFLTGRHPNRYGTFAPNWSIRPEEISIAHLLKKAGYLTAHFGKWHVGPVKKDSPTSPGAMGFDTWLSHDNFFEMDPILSRNGAPPEKIKGESSEILVQEAIQFIEANQENGKPFLLVIWYGSPHEPYSGLQSDLELYAHLPDSLRHKKVKLTSKITGTATQRPLRDVLMERYAEITAMDRSIGQLRDYLINKGMKDNTLLWYCGDNGTPSSAARTSMTLRGQKGTMYEGGIRVPGVIEWPQHIRAPQSTVAPMFTTDILPTLAAITGQNLPHRPIDGINLYPMWKDKTIIRAAPLCFWAFRPNAVFGDDPTLYLTTQQQEGTTPLAKKMNGKYTRSFRNYVYSAPSKNDFGGTRVIIQGRYKLIAYGAALQPDRFELFDLSTDAGETLNLAAVHQPLVKEMHSALMRWQESVLSSLAGSDY